ncbi:MAG: hypothetical protein A2987_06295 [Omnitrophica bacterium RIFCSPLOWO2_01_FULL_45_10]|nr:MAG: hypothetical protein A2987_06295 [Omnitrophica bacterium RIFCSPLOWO2_01_FULL_45_10]
MVYAEKIKKIILLVSVYTLIFWVGFRLGEIYNRSSKRPAPRPAPRIFYIVERHADATHSWVDINSAGVDHMFIKFFLNKDLRPLLKYKNIKIYSSRGVRIY